MNLLFFGRLGSVLGRQENWERPDTIRTVEELILHLKQRGSPWQEALAGPYRVALDGTLTDRQASIETAQELAFLPPVTGG